MANLTTVKEGLSEQGWVNPNVVLVRDEGTGQHYVVSTLDSATVPWKDQPETLVFPTDAEGSVPGTAEAFVAGDDGMTREQALADLNTRLDNGTLYSEDEAEAIAEAATERDFEKFLATVMPQEVDATS